MPITDCNHHSETNHITDCNRFESDGFYSNFYVLDDILLSEGHLCGVYIGSSGIFVLADLRASPEALYRALRDLFGTTMLRLYIADKGLYDPAERSAYTVYTDDELYEQIRIWISSDSVRWAESRMAEFQDRLLVADKRCRGPYSGSDGETYFLRRGTICMASNRSSTAFFYLTIFGGVFGIHRFALGEVFPGLLYLFTGGLFGIGWLLDLLSLFLGLVKDKKGRYLLPLPNRLRKLAVVPIGILFSSFVFLLYTKSLSVFADILGSGVSHQIRLMDSGAIRTIESFIGQFGK